MTRNNMAAGYCTDVQVLIMIIFSSQISSFASEQCAKFTLKFTQPYHMPYNKQFLVLNVNFKKKLRNENIQTVFLQRNKQV
jgi:hypothetical protein